jgi:hypothetical protein
MFRGCPKLASWLWPLMELPWYYLVSAVCGLRSAVCSLLFAVCCLLAAVCKVVSGLLILLARNSLTTPRSQFPNYNNRGLFAWVSCEVDRCNAHSGKGPTLQIIDFDAKTAVTPAFFPSVRLLRASLPGCPAKLIAAMYIAKI